MSIQSFAQADLEEFYYEGKLPRRCKWAKLQKSAMRKLEYLDVAIEVEDLRVPPGNRLEKLQGDLEGLWSIRVNNQWRIVFCWEEDQDGPSQVEMMDYH